MNQSLKYANQAEVATRPEYLAGFDAYFAGFDRDEHHYKDGSESEAAWLLGWWDACNLADSND